MTLAQVHALDTDPTCISQNLEDRAFDIAVVPANDANSVTLHDLMFVPGH
jgi:hypothetical protein